MWSMASAPSTIAYRRPSDPAVAQGATPGRTPSDRSRLGGRQPGPAVAGASRRLTRRTTGGFGRWRLLQGTDGKAGPTATSRATEVLRDRHGQVR
jgi:hypothetical protein